MANIPTADRPVWVQKPIRDRILDNVVEEPGRGCWIWSGSKAPDGYGRIIIRYRTRLVHRVSYEEFVGPIPDGLQIDHLCNVTACCNPRHLQPVTQQENARRAAERRRRARA